MDFMRRGGEEYFALMLYFLYFAEQEETLKGNVNSICCCEYIMKVGYCWGSLVFNLCFRNTLNFPFYGCTH